MWETGAGSRLSQQLTEREMQVLCRFAQGQLHHEIASALGITTRTVETHLRNIRLKVSVPRSADLVRVACLAGLILPPQHERLSLAVALIRGLTLAERERVLRLLMHGVPPAANSLPEAGVRTGR